MVRTATAGTIAPNHGWSGGSVTGLARSLGAIGLLPVSERWRSSFFASHSHVTTRHFFKNWMHSEGWHGRSGHSVVRAVSAFRGGWSSFFASKH